MSENREYTITDVGQGEPETGAFGNPMGDGRVKLSGRPSGLDPVEGSTSVFSVDEIQETIDPREINTRRSETAREADAAKDAPLTSDPLTWASDPSQYDFPGVDTGPTFREAEGDDFDTEGFLDNLL